MTYGEECPPGHLPVYSVGSTEEAHTLLVLACPKNAGNQFIAPELAAEQTLANLSAFSDRLHRAHDVLVKNGGCACSSSRSGRKKSTPSSPSY